MKLGAVLAAVFAMGLAASFAIAGPQQTSQTAKTGTTGKSGKIAICHKTQLSGKPRVTLRVSEKALKGHLKHGDTRGSCTTTTTTTTVGQTTAHGQDQVTVCHRTHSHTNGMVEIEVSRNALAAHLKHGDTQGACPSSAAGPKKKKK